MARTRASLWSLALALLGASIVVPATAQTTSTGAATAGPPASAGTSTKPASSKPATPKPAATKPAPTKPATTKPATAKPATGSATKPAATTAAKPSTAATATKPAPARQSAPSGGSKPAAAPPPPKPTVAAPKPPTAKSDSPALASPAAPVTPAAPLPPVQTTPLKDAGPTAARPAAPGVGAPSFLERHPVMGGFAAGLLGTSLAHSFLGGGPAEDAPGAPRDANVLEPVPQTSQTAETAGQFTRLALFGGLVYLGVAAWRRRAQETAPASAALRERSVPSVSDWDGAGGDAAPGFDGLTHPDNLKDIADDEDFAEILRAVQSAWSEGNIALIRAHVTPEMADHYNDALAQNSRNGIESRVEQVSEVRVERLRDWAEDGLQFASARMRWRALDYLIDVAKTPDEAGYVIDGSADEPVDCEETWTFVRVPDGAWVLTDVEAES